jgi:hypothetical protein
MQALLVPGGDGNMEVNQVASTSAMNVCGSSIFRQYRAGLKHIHMKQQQNNPQHSKSLWLHILESNRIKGLEDYINRRAPAAKKARYEEKVDLNIMPYKMIESKGKIETQLWNIGSETRIGGMAGLRDRFSYLLSDGSVICSESNFKSELSDLIDFHYKAPREPHAYHILILLIWVGKVNQASKTLWGRVLRHRLAILCSIGALGFYLLLRFDVTSKVNLIDWKDNASWFDFKVLITSTGKFLCIVFMS